MFKTSKDIYYNISHNGVNSNGLSKFNKNSSKKSSSKDKTLPAIKDAYNK